MRCGFVVACSLLALGQTPARSPDVPERQHHHRHHAPVVDAAAVPVNPPSRDDDTNASDTPRVRRDGHCTVQTAQAFLVRSNANRSHEGRVRSLRYRTEHYGRFGGFGEPGWNAHTPSELAGETHFAGHALHLNRGVIPVLACVERAIHAHCAADDYHPRAVSGLRTRNTFAGGEVSNHVFGIAVDVDPDRNPCCGCAAPFRDAPVCARHVQSEFERMVMPRCWVEQFERYGFYWLGHDAQLRDMMHFEFLGVPSRG